MDDGGEALQKRSPLTRSPAIIRPSGFRENLFLSLQRQLCTRGREIAATSVHRSRDSGIPHFGQGAIHRFDPGGRNLPGVTSLIRSCTTGGHSPDGNQPKTPSFNQGSIFVIESSLGRFRRWAPPSQFLPSLAWFKHADPAEHHVAVLFAVSSSNSPETGNLGSTWPSREGEAARRLANSQKYGISLI